MNFCLFLKGHFGFENIGRNWSPFQIIYKQFSLDDGHTMVHKRNCQAFFVLEN